MRWCWHLAVVILLLQSESVAQTLQPLWLEGGAVTALAWYNGRLYVGTNGQGLWCYSPQEQRWTSLGLEGISIRAVYPHDVGPLGWCIAAGVRPSGVGADTVLIYCWTPPGSQWRPMDQGLDRERVSAIYALDGFPDPRICGETFAGGYWGVYRRPLGAEKWENVCWWSFA